MSAKTDLNNEASKISREALITVILNIILTYITLSTDVINNWWNPVKRGFYCFDENLSNPFYPNTVPTKSLFIVALGLPPLVIIMTECCIQTSNAASKKIIIIKTLADGFFGLVCIGLITNMTKYVVGRLR